MSLSSASSRLSAAGRWIMVSRQWWTAVLLAATVLALHATGTAAISCMIFGFPGLKYDGVDRTTELTERTFNRTVFARNTKNVVFFSDVEADDDELDQYECFLQISAQVIEKRGYKVFTVNTTKDARLRKQEGVERGEDTVHVYKDGYKIEYFGVVDPHYFVSWILDIPDDPLTVINSKHIQNEWKSLKDNQVRIIGYFSPGSAELKDFEEAAEDFMGEIRFYAVVDTFWARSMGITKLGEVRMYRPFDSTPLIAPHTVDTEEEFEDWVNDNREPIMQQLTYQNYFNVWKDPEPDERMIVAFCDDEEEDGEALFNLLKQINRNNVQYAGTLEILLIDPDDFPLMIDEWESMFNIEIEEGPQIGLVDISDREGVWFDMTQLNLKEWNEYEAQNLEVLQAWVDQIMDGSIRLGEPEPEPVTVPPKGRRKRGEL